MKTIITFLLVTAFTFTAFASTYTEDFNTADNWSTDPPGGDVDQFYPITEKVYINDSAEPANDEFRSVLISWETAKREDTVVYGGSGYAFCFSVSGSTLFRYKIDKSVVDFSAYFARKSSSAFTYTVKYSKDSGDTYTDLFSTNQSWFSADNTYKKYSSGPINISPDTGDDIYIEVEKEGWNIIYVDQFEVNYVPEPMFLGLLGLALLFVRRK